MEMLKVARYKCGYIKIADYNHSIHKGQVFCPFCDPQLELTGVENNFFRALPNKGGHNCAKKAAIYFNANWEGRKLIEYISDGNGKIEVIIDITKLSKVADEFTIGKRPTPTETDNKTYKRYITYKKIIRDVVRTVIQMKNFIEKNSIDNLNKIKFKYKLGKEELNINEVVKLVDELTPSVNYKDRFVIYKVESVRISKEKIYINSYKTNGISLTVSFKYPSNNNCTGINKNDFVIAFGTLIQDIKNISQYYLNILSDLNIVPINNEELEHLFANKQMVKRQITISKNKYSFPPNMEGPININKEMGVNADSNNSYTLNSLNSVAYGASINTNFEHNNKNVVKESIKEELNHTKKELGFFKRAAKGLNNLLRRK